MRKGHFEDLLTAVDSFKNAAGATITDIRKCLTSLGRRLAPKTVTDGLKRAIRLGFVVSAKRRYYPVSQFARTHIVQSRRGRRRGKRGKPSCPCFSKTRYRTAARRTYSRRRQLEGHGSLQVRSRRRRFRRRRNRRRMVHAETLQRGDGIVRARRRRTRSTRRRRLGKRRDNQEDSDLTQINYLVRPIKVELEVESDSTKVQEPKINEETVGGNEKEKENTVENSSQTEEQNAGRKSGENTEETGENNEDSKQSGGGKHEDQSGSSKDDREGENRSQNEFEDRKNADMSDEDSLRLLYFRYKDNMETDDYEYNSYN